MSSDLKDTFFFVKKKKQLIKLVSNDIKFIEVKGRYCEVNTQKGNFILQVALSQFVKELPKPHFLRTHRNYIVNTEKIVSIYPDDNLIILEDNEQVLLSRRYKDIFFKNYKVYV